MNKPSTTVLIAEDEESFVDAITLGLRKEGFNVEIARDGREALDQFELVAPDVILLDVMLPKISGIDVCKTIRITSQVPIIMVTARTSELDTVVGLEVGADDYVAKPFRMRELTARIRAVLRRAPSTPQSDEEEELLEIGDITLDTARHELRVKGTPVALPLKEFELLELLMSNPNRVMTRDMIIDRVWGPYHTSDTKTLDVHIKRLRTKIEPDPATPTYITTVRGLGYRFEVVPK
ncbi:MAG: response regulator transcription factor [Actinomycetota bacterium]|jgi:two-component system response regulator RegX3|nr:response regulator transcription factor [Actinomycetota bacterium]